MEGNVFEGVLLVVAALKVQSGWTFLFSWQTLLLFLSRTPFCLQLGGKLLPYLWERKRFNLSPHSVAKMLLFLVGRRKKTMRRN